MESSRIFVRGLPPSLTAEDFTKHFSKQSVVTDVKFIPHRRIGYVGYKSPADAARAVKYHNKSFIRMSRIGVELARSVEEQFALGAGHNAANATNRTYGGNKADNPTSADVGGERKRKRESVVGDGDKAKLQEFLEVMQPPSKLKTWENQDAINAQAITEPTTTANGEGEHEIRSEDEYEPVPKKQKSESKKNRKVEQGFEAPQAEAASPQQDDAIGIAEQGSEVAVQGPLDTMQPASDADWLRSRTSRLLGLVADDDALGQNNLSEDGEDRKAEMLSNSELVEDVGNADASVQTDEEVKKADDTTVALPFHSEEGSPMSNGRIFVRNLTYTTTEEELRHHFENGAYGTIEEVHLPIDSRSGHNKGFAHIQYVEPEAAVKALQDLDRSPFQGRLLHVMPGESKKGNSLDEFAISKLPLKKQQQIKRKAEAASSTFNWNSMYMNSDAVMSSISDRLGVSKSELLDPTSSSAAVKQAHAETNIIQETRSYFTTNGIDLEAFKRRERGDMAILVKNFSYGTKAEELKKVFEAHGHVRRILMPPSGTIAIIEFIQPDHARSAFGRLAYSKFKDSILFLEKAPQGLFKPHRDDSTEVSPSARTVKPSATDLLETNGALQSANTSTLFVRNLNFITTTERLREIFKPLDGFLSARVKTKPDPKKSRQLLSMGFGFLEFRSKEHAQAALAAMDGYKLDGHELLIRASHKAIDAAEVRRKEDHAKKVADKGTKIIIKNLPFEASKKDVQSLFGPYGQLRSVRVPKKFDSSTRGFAFADFVTAREAENAVDALKDTHLLGRRLVLEFAAEDAVDPEEEIEKMQRKVGKQADKVALQKLAGTGRKKFNVEGVDELDQG